MLTAADSGGRRAQEAKGAPVRPDPESVEGRVDNALLCFCRPPLLVRRGSGPELRLRSASASWLEYPTTCQKYHSGVRADDSGPVDLSLDGPPPPKPQSLQQPLAPIVAAPLSPLVPLVQIPPISRSISNRKSCQMIPQNSGG